MTRTRKRAALSRNNIGFLLAKASQRWNELLQERFEAAGYRKVRPSFGSVLVPLFEEDGLRIGELAQRAKLSKQTMTTMVRLVEGAGFVTVRADPEDGRASRVHLTKAARAFQPTAQAVVSNLEDIAAEIADEEEFERVRRWLQRFANL